VITDFILLSIGGGTADTNKVLRENFYPIFPAYCLGRGFFVLSTRNDLAAFGVIEIPPIYSRDALGGPITFLLGEASLSFVLTLTLQALGACPRLTTRHFPVPSLYLPCPAPHDATLHDSWLVAHCPLLIA
jgi:hypothetical protein